MPTITNYMLKQTLQNISNPSSTPIKTSSGGGVTSESTTQENQTKVSIDTRKFKTITEYGKKIKFYDNKTATILNPMPFTKWKSKNAPDKNGAVTLDVELEAVTLTVGDQCVVLGFPDTNCGLSHDLQLLVDLGESEVLIDDEYISIKTKHLAKNGVEQ